MRLTDMNFLNATTGTYPSRALPRSGNSISSRHFGLALLALDILALSLAAWAASVLTVLFEVHIINMPPYTLQPDVVALRNGIFPMLALVQLAVFWNKGLYSEQRIPWWSQVEHIAKVSFGIFLLDGFISFALKLHEPRMLIFASWICALAFIVAFRWVALRLASRFNVSTIPTVIIGDTNTVTDLLYAFDADPCAGYRVKTIFLRDREYNHLDTNDLPSRYKDVQIRDGLTEYEHYINKNPECFYVVSLEAFRGRMRDKLINHLDNVKASYAIVPAINRVGLYETEPRYFFGHDIMMLQSKTVGPYTSPTTPAKAVKRAMDIMAAGTALLLLSPLFAAVSLMLKLEGQGGSLFYGGKRIGEGGRKFSCWKFRSMEPNSDHLLHAYLDSDPEAAANWEKYRKLERDPRVTTRTARFIRKASIDELPQLWNVLVGDMSLVGPRPILEDEKSYFGDALKDYYSVRPGLTGLWQVSGRNATSFRRRVYWDSWYIRNWSLWGDIVILIKTPFVLISRKGAS